ncbi:pentatricopeptide repeat-containing protein At4g02750 [Cryptomeria japonica]|uniref:pentatricopeptide repeat-containing protein At4g02750 n=1 Tax=Cryptomeria japonica TaxID=3369 RepID=UPI0025AB7763|nr:pentatricopeptide repeat-containing protein At4g02750 [Cryptomeria japonica]
MSLLPYLKTKKEIKFGCAYVQILHTGIAKNTLSQGSQIHSLITHRGLTFSTRIFLENNLVNLYVKCGTLVDARKVFDEMKERDGFSWNVVIAAYRRYGYPHEALKLFDQMQQTGVQPDQFTFASILPACAKIRALEQGVDIHQRIKKSGYSTDVVIASALVDMYTKCGILHKAHELFDEMPHRNMVSWNTMITGYTKNGAFDEAFRLFEEMPQRDVVSWSTMIAGFAKYGLLEKAFETFKQMKSAGVKPNSTTFAGILPACGKMQALEQGMNIHLSIFESGYWLDTVCATALLDMYAKCGTIHKARKLFDRMHQRNVISWNAMIAGYLHNGVLDEAISLFKEMPQRDVVSWNLMIAGYAQNGILDEALRLFKEMPQRNVVSWTAMAAGYTQNGALDKALRLFKEMPRRDVVTWNMIIAGYARNGFSEKALEIFKNMQLTGVQPDEFVLASILSACAKMGALEQGMDVHRSIIISGFLSDVVVASALVDMYAKCGSIQKARQLFDNMSRRNALSWNAMITGYAMHGFHKDALKFFELMKHSGIYPDNVSYIGVLFACGHAGLVDEGCKYFNGMNNSYNMIPTLEHYVCTIDLLGRAGYLEEALNFIIKMPIKPVAIVWMSLLGTCKSYKNIELGVYAASLLFELDPQNSASYVLLSNIYAEEHRWGDNQKVRRLMIDRGIKKLPGSSCIQVHKMVHDFA